MMAKTDNHNPRAKLELRRYFLRKYHSDCPPDVLDCCQGGGVLWRKLREEFPVASYWGLDLKPKKGRLKLDSVRVLQQPGWPQNVIDIDTYGLPWRHWVAMLPHVSKPLTVFLTIGNVANGPGSVASREELGAIGLGRLGVKIPASFTLKVIRNLSVTYCLTTGCDSVRITEAVEAVSDGNARYIGVRLEPRKTNGQPLQPASRPEPEQVGKEPAHV